MAKSDDAKKTKSELWPGRVTPARVLVALSVLFNVAVIGLGILVIWTTVLDDLVINQADDLICGENTAIQATNVEGRAALDYQCMRGDARQFYLEGLNKYRETLKLPPVTE